VGRRSKYKWRSADSAQRKVIVVSSSSSSSCSCSSSSSSRSSVRVRILILRRAEVPLGKRSRCEWRSTDVAQRKVIVVSCSRISCSCNYQL